MVFFINLFISKRGSLAKIWLAAHWERKLTKTHVFECNLESIVREIMSPEIDIGLRTFGHLLLGVVRIFSRKAKYLLEDCNDAFLKINVTFRPDLTDLPKDALEATAKAITLIEDFTAFDHPLPQLSDFDALDHFSLNQSRAEEITLKEDFGNSFLNCTISVDAPQAEPTVLDVSFQSLAHEGDSFGDEGRGLDLLDFLNWSDNTLSDLRKEASNQDSKTSLLNETPDQEEPMEATINETLALERVLVTVTVERRKRLKRKNKSGVDRVTELSSKIIKNQITDYSDLVTSLDMAPPTRALMRWKESGGADKLFSQMCTAVISPQIQELFSTSLILRTLDVSLEVEKFRQEELKDTSDLTGLEDPSPGFNGSNIHEFSPDLALHRSVTDERVQDEFRSDLTLPEVPSEDSLFVHPSANTQTTQRSAMNSQDLEEGRMSRRAKKLHQLLKSCSDTSFSVRALCAESDRSQAANVFSSLLVLQKQEVVQLHQKAPYRDIQVTPGPKFFHF